MADEPTEDDPKYAVKTWGPDYRSRPEYWEWLRAREVLHQATKPKTIPFGWGGNVRPPTRSGGW